MLRLSPERTDVEQAVEELRRSSFIDIIVSEEDDESFLAVPLVASVFGRRKLSVSPLKPGVEANTNLLLYFGAGQKTDIRHGIATRVQRFFSRVAEEVSVDSNQLQAYVPTLEFIAHRHPSAWLLLSRLYQESRLDGSFEQAKQALRRYLESGPDYATAREAWQDMAQLCRLTEDGVGEATALIELCELDKTSLETISNAINRWNSLFRHQLIRIGIDERETLGQKLLELFISQSAAATATDYSRAGWLALALHREQLARDYGQEGLRLDPENEYCLNLIERVEGR